MITVTRSFSLEEARKTIPLVKQIVLDILSTGHELNRIVENMDGIANVNVSIERLVYKTQGYIYELQELGCYYSDWKFTEGRVDFPATVNGKEVFLCWQFGDDDIEYYYEIDSSFANKKPLPQNMLLGVPYNGYFEPHNGLSV